MKEKTRKTTASSVPIADIYLSSVSRAVEGTARRVRLPPDVGERFQQLGVKTVVLLPWSKHCVLAVAQSLWRRLGLPMRLFSHTDFSEKEIDCLRRALVLSDSRQVDKKGRITIPIKLHKHILNSCRRVTIIPLSPDILELWDESEVETMEKVGEEDMALTRGAFLKAVAGAGNGQQAHRRPNKG